MKNRCTLCGLEIENMTIPQEHGFIIGELFSPPVFKQKCEGVWIEVLE